MTAVCDSCLQANCWEGDVMCRAARGAGVIEIPQKILDRLAEHQPGMRIVAMVRGSSIDLSRQKPGRSFVAAPELDGWLELVGEPAP